MASATLDCSVDPMAYAPRISYEDEKEKAHIGTGDRVGLKKFLDKKEPAGRQP